jgi:uncharacterized protein YecE (DUF72 family)
VPLQTSTRRCRHGSSRLYERNPETARFVYQLCYPPIKRAGRGRRGVDGPGKFPIVRYHGRDAAERTIEGWQPWLDVVAAWLREGRAPTVFIHTPDNASSLDLARRFHDEVRALVAELEPLPEPQPTEPMTLF